MNFLKIFNIIIIILFFSQASDIKALAPSEAVLKELSNDKVKVFETILAKKLEKLALINRIPSDLDAPRIIKDALNPPRSDSDETKNTSQTQRTELDEFKRLVLSVYKTYIGIFGEFIFNNDETLEKEIEYILKHTRIYKDTTIFYYWKHLAFFALIYGIFITTFFVFFDKLVLSETIYKITTYSIVIKYTIYSTVILSPLVWGGLIFAKEKVYWHLPKYAEAISTLLFRKTSIDAVSVFLIAHELGHRIHSEFIKHHYNSSRDFTEGFAELMAGVILENFGKEPIDYWGYNNVKISSDSPVDEASFLAPYPKEVPKGVIIFMYTAVGTNLTLFITILHVFFNWDPLWFLAPIPIFYKLYKKITRQEGKLIETEQKSIPIDIEEGEFIPIPDPYTAEGEYDRVRYSLGQFIHIKKNEIAPEIRNSMYSIKDVKTQEVHLLFEGRRKQAQTFVDTVKSLTLRDVARKMIEQMEQYGTEWKLAYFMALRDLGLNILSPENMGKQTNNAMSIRPAMRETFTPDSASPISTSA